MNRQTRPISAKTISFLTIAVLVLSSIGLAKYSGGSGEPNNPYQISSVADWQKLMASPADWAGHFILTSDIDLNGVFIIPIAWDMSTSSGFQGTQFTGVFDGNEHIIRNADLNMPGGDYVGLFGYLGTNGQIKNLGVEDVSILGRNYVGGMVAGNSGIITNCYSTGSVSGSYYVGGLVGGNFNGTISNCYSTVSVSGEGSVGGLVGYNFYGNISNCYSTGSVNGYGSVGGLVGQGGGVVVGSFWDIKTSGQLGSSGGKGVTTEQMKSLIIYRNAGWAGKGWIIEDGLDYPRLAWEGTPGVPIPEDAPVPLLGDGTEQNPYQIWTSEDFAVLSWHTLILDKHIELKADLDLAGIALYPIGDLGGFMGVFDGNGYVIHNADVNMPGSDYVGLFGYLGTNGQIKNLDLEDVSIVGRNYVGGLVGYNSGAIINCYSTGSVSGTGDCVGGLVGYNYGAISNCYSTGSVSGTYGVGGLVGENYQYGTISNCYSTASVSGTGGYVGGLVGDNNEGTISKCYSTGSVSGTTNVGGLVGKDDFQCDNYADLGNLSDEINHNLRGWDQVGSWGGSSSGDTTARCQRIGEDNLLEFCVAQTDIPYVLSAEIVDGTCEDNFEIYVNGIGPIYSYISNKNDGITIKTHQVIIDSGYIPYSRVEVNLKNTSNDLGCGDAAMYYGRAPVYNVKLTPLSYSTGSASGTTGVGIPVGYSYYYATTSSSFWDVNTSGWATSAGGTPKTTAEMKTMSTFTDAGWDFVEIWGIGENQTYPFLRTEPAGDSNHDKKVDLVDLAILASHWLEAAE